MPQLDGLRALAVALVLIHHFTSSDSLPLGLGHLPLGYMGVRLFFVLSGFLITGILLRERLAVESNRTTIKISMRQFYIRRFLRIFPLYYFVIAITLALGLEETSKHWATLVTYTFNIELSIQGWYPKYIGHFWSLSVEEQYYIIWPLIILLAPRHRIITITLILVALAPIYRYLAYINDFKTIAIYTFTFSSLDALGVGSLLAILSMDQDGKLILERLLTRKFAILMLFLIIFLQALMVNQLGWPVYLVFFELIVAFLFSWAVWRASTGSKSIGGKILGCSTLVYLGKISYGIYVYHYFSPYIVRSVSNMLNVELHRNGLAEFILFTALTVMMASFSWYIFEAPINRLKRHFQYVSTTNQS
jgi:peptidoglycan/LPS O-acetylase OafA/YrhL